MMVATTLVMAATGCSQKEAGTVSTDGSTSMEKVYPAICEIRLIQLLRK